MRQAQQVRKVHKAKQVRRVRKVLPVHRVRLAHRVRKVTQVQQVRLVQLGQPGVAAGGTAGQVLTKKSGTDYDTEWKDASGGSSIKTLKVDSAYISLFFGSGKTFGDGSLKFDVAFKSSDNTIAGFCSRNNDSTSTSAGCLVATLKNIASSNTIIGVKMCNVFVGDGSTFTEKSIDYDLVFNNRLSASSLAGGIDLFFVYHTQALSESVAKYAQAKTASDTYFTITYLEGTA